MAQARAGVANGAERPGPMRRFRAMSFFLPWPAVGGSMLAAAALGIHLGESAIDLIHPIHFQGPAVHPRDRGAAIDPDQLAARGTAYRDLYGWDEGRLAMMADCGDCDALRARDAFVPPARLDGYAEDDPASVRVHRGGAVPATEWRAAQEASRQWAEEMARSRQGDVVLGYVDFPVEGTEQEPAAARRVEKR
jgi:hypothetical protein